MDKKKIRQRARDHYLMNKHREPNSLRDQKPCLNYFKLNLLKYLGKYKDKKTVSCKELCTFIVEQGKNKSHVDIYNSYFTPEEEALKTSELVKNYSKEWNSIYFNEMINYSPKDGYLFDDNSSFNIFNSNSIKKIIDLLETLYESMMSPRLRRQFSTFFDSLEDFNEKKLNRLSRSRSSNLNNSPEQYVKTTLNRSISLSKSIISDPRLVINSKNVDADYVVLKNYEWDKDFYTIPIANVYIKNTSQLQKTKNIKYDIDTSKFAFTFLYDSFWYYINEQKESILLDSEPNFLLLRNEKLSKQIFIGWKESTFFPNKKETVGREKEFSYYNNVFKNPYVPYTSLISIFNNCELLPKSNIENSLIELGDIVYDKKHFTKYKNIITRASKRIDARGSIVRNLQQFKNSLKNKNIIEKYDNLVIFDPEFGDQVNTAILKERIDRDINALKREKASDYYKWVQEFSNYLLRTTTPNTPILLTILWNILRISKNGKLNILIKHKDLDQLVPKDEYNDSSDLEEHAFFKSMFSIYKIRIIPFFEDENFTANKFNIFKFSQDYSLLELKQSKSKFNSESFRELMNSSMDDITQIFADSAMKIMNISSNSSNVNPDSYTEYKQMEIVIKKYEEKIKKMDTTISQLELEKKEYLKRPNRISHFLRDILGRNKLGLLKIEKLIDYQNEIENSFKEKINKQLSINRKEIEYILETSDQIRKSGKIKIIQNPIDPMSVRSEIIKAMEDFKENPIYSEHKNMKNINLGVTSDGLQFSPCLIFPFQDDTTDFSHDSDMQPLIIDIKNFIEMALNNLLKNTLKHAFDEEHKKVTIQVTIILDDFGFEEGYDQIIYKDNGKGHNEDNTSALFDMFQRGEKNVNTFDGDGEGIGLNSLYELIQGHGGVCEIDNEKNNGFKVTMKFPSILRNSDDLEEQRKKSIEKRVKRVNKKNRKS